jgi:iron complex outermembrane receptor protein
VNDYDPRVITRFGYQCNRATDPTPGPFLPITTTVCPAGTSSAGQAPSLFWINYFSAPGTAEGVELELTASPVDGLALNGSMGYYKYESDEKNPAQDGYIHSSVREQPRLSYSLGAQYAIQFAAGTLTPRIDMFYQGERTNGNVKVQQLKPYHIVPDYTLYNARLTFASADSKWNMALAVENLFDEFYWITMGPERGDTGVTTVYNRSGVPGRGREWSVSLRRNF